jgi:hypothetical protein
VTRPLLAAFFCALALRCTPAEEANGPITATNAEDIPKYTTAGEPDVDTDNLLNLAYGAAVVSRTAELALENSAVHAIDSSITTSWASPPGGTAQTFVFSLRTPARITRIGVTSAESDENTPTSLAFETSLDGSSWRPLQTVQPKGSKESLYWDVNPTDTQYLRVTTAGNGPIFIRSLFAGGEELRPPSPPVMNGCWQINELPARFQQSGATITGIIATDPPTLLDGGTNGRIGHFLWTQGPMWGYGAIALSPDSSRLAGLRIHEEISTQQYGEGWFGEAIPCPANLTPPAPGSLTPRTPEHRWTVYGLAFDREDRLLAPSSPALDTLARRIAAIPDARFRIVAYELRDNDPATNRKKTDARLAAIRTALQARSVDLARVTFRSAGNELKEPPIHTALQRQMASRIDLERF